MYICIYVYISLTELFSSSDRGLSRSLQLPLGHYFT